MVDWRCKMCMWFDFRTPVLQGGHELSGFCRKKWPIVRQDSEGNYRGNWTLVELEDFCGEWMPDKGGA